jgi:hypothetical protein
MVGSGITGTGYITTEYTAWCKGCAYWSQTAEAMNKTHAREIFHKQGFRTVGGFLWCRTCLGLGRQKEAFK